MSNNLITCQYCENFFASNSILRHHQKTAKYCLKKQGKINKQFQCKVCEKYYSSNYNLKQHTCPKEEIKEQNEDQIKIFQEQQIKDLQQQVRDLQNKLENVAIKSITKPTTTIHKKTINKNKTNIINNLLPITDEYLEQQIENFTLDHIRKKGASGYVQYALEYPFKDRMACVDFARKKVIWKDQEEKIKEDLDMSEITQKFFQSIEEKNRELIIDYYIKLGQHVDNETYNMEKMIYDTKIKEVREIAEGDNPPLKSKFIKGVCQKTISKT